jgi:type II secretory pathway component PulF
MSFTVLGALRDLDESRHRAELYRAWSTGMSAGFAEQFSLEQIGRINSPRTEELRRYMLVSFQQGREIGPLVSSRPRLFEPFEGAILAAGGPAGLPTAVPLLADYYAREYRHALKVRSLMGYPIFLGVAAAFGLTTPFLHRGGIEAYLFAIGGAVVALLLMGGIPISIIANIVAGRRAFGFPRFVRALAIGAQVGLPPGRIVRLAVDVSGNGELRQHIAKRSQRQLNIIPMSTLFEGCRLVPKDLIGQMKVAEATGEYAALLKLYADEFERRK